MWLYRVFGHESDDSGIFYDATSSQEAAIRFAEVIKRRNPTHRVTVEAENWPTLSWSKYWFYQATGTSEGFGAEFKRKTGHNFTDIKTIQSE